MSRIRTIKPDFWRHEELSELPEATHMLAAALLNYADDEGYFNANPKLIKAECSPLREPSVSIHDSLTALSSVGFLKIGRGADGRSYGHIVNFLGHQRINRPVPSKIKDLEIAWECSLTTHPQLTESSPPEGKGREEEIITVGSASLDPHPADAGSDGSGSGKPKGPKSYPQEFDELWQEYRGVCDVASAEPGSKRNAFERWRKLSAEDRQSCYLGVLNYGEWRIDRKSSPTAFTAAPKHLERFITGRMWETYQTEVH